MLLSLLLLLMLWLLLLQLLLALPVLLLLQLLLARASSLRYLPSLLSPLPRRRVSSMPLMSTVVLGPDEIDRYNRERQVSFPPAHRFLTTLRDRHRDTEQRLLARPHGLAGVRLEGVGVSEA